MQIMGVISHSITACFNQEPYSFLRRTNVLITSISAMGGFAPPMFPCMTGGIILGCSGACVWVSWGFFVCFFCVYQ